MLLPHTAKNASISRQTAHELPERSGCSHEERIKTRSPATRPGDQTSCLLMVGSRSTTICAGCCLMSLMSQAKVEAYEARSTLAYLICKFPSLKILKQQTVRSMVVKSVLKPIKSAIMLNICYERILRKILFLISNHSTVTSHISSLSIAGYCVDANTSLSFGLGSRRLSPASLQQVERARHFYFRFLFL